jgi:hypothetical protein
MRAIDTVVFGDNQFFGINHMSQERAQQLAEQFYDLENIFRVYRTALDAGVRAIMLNSNDRAAEICAHFRAHAADYPPLAWYPSIPYPHKFANLISEAGLLGALNAILFKDASALTGLGAITQGGLAFLSRDAMQLMRMLVDVEMRMFAGLDVRAVFLQNVVTDLLLGLGLREFFAGYCEHVRRKYQALPGLITQNLPRLRTQLRDWGITEVVICTSINKLGYLMSPGVAAYEEALAANDPRDYQIMAMSTLASGAIPAVEAYRYVNALNVQSVVFGASSRRHIEETVGLIAPAGAAAGGAPRAAGAHA